MSDQHAGTLHVDAPETPADLLAALVKANTLPLWDRYSRLVPTEIKTPDTSMLWPWAEIEPLVVRSLAEAPMTDSERNTLLLVNPVFGGDAVTTTNLIVDFQFMMPGQFTTVHRHSTSAIRLVVEGNCGVTTVNGKACSMREGDLVLNPQWCWHEYSNDGDERVVWLDGLDLPLLRHLGTVVVEHGERGRKPARHLENLSRLPDTAFASAGLVPVDQPAAPVYSPMFRYPWTSVVAALDAMPPGADGTRKLRYTDPLTGGPVTPTLDCYAWSLARGAETTPYRSTSNAVCLVVEGEGVSSVGGVTHHWQPHDVFSIPHWNWTTHRATTPGAKLFLLTDREVLNRLALLREETR